MVTMTARIDEKLQAAVAAGTVPGVVATAAGPDGVLYEGAAGNRSAAADDPITPDTMMRIASMTKMVTTTAALQLLVRPVQHPFLGGPGQRDHRRDLLPDPAVPRATSSAALRRLRGGSLRVTVKAAD